MDSKAVNAQLRKVVRPVLRAAGFSAFTDRNAWRFGDATVDVVNVQSFNSYLASGVGCTTYSFSVNLGVYLSEVPQVDLPRPTDRPPEYACHFRRRLHRSFAQPELERRDTWYIDEEGVYLPRAAEDVRAALLRDAEPWFERLRSRDEALRILTMEHETDALWGFGANPSPRRSYILGYVARAAGRVDLAATALSAALRSGSYDTVREQLARDIESCRSGGV